MKERASVKKLLIRIILTAACAALLFCGLKNDGYRDVKNKATKICYECMGIG